MQPSFSQLLPAGLIDFLLVISFSLLIGLSQRRLNLNKETSVFGTDRTFTLIGLLGYLLYRFSPSDFSLFAGGGLVMALLLGLNYYYKIGRQHDYGMTTIVTALITYCMGPLVCLMPSWMYVSVVVVVLLLAEMKSTFVELAQKMNNDEFITLAKFMLIAFIILPMLPDERFIPEINLTPYRIWLTTVIVSAISYVSYLLRQYVFHKSSIVVSGIIGGLYSSTATITILSKKCKTAPAEQLPDYLVSMFMAVGMMFLRLLVIIAIFNWGVFVQLVVPMCLLSAVSCGIGFYINQKKGGVLAAVRGAEVEPLPIEQRDNPLEFKVALIFAFLFVLFSLLTHFAMVYLGTRGINLLALVAGVGDITPFILNVLDGKAMGVPAMVVITASLLATLSNNLVKMAYAIGFSGGRKELTKPLVIGFAVLSLANGLAFLFLL
jgi:uncharacterized membrane protein (DUF4010 family)